MPEPECEELFLDSSAYVSADLMNSIREAWKNEPRTYTISVRNGKYHVGVSQDTKEQKRVSGITDRILRRHKLR